MRNIYVYQSGMPTMVGSKKSVCDVTDDKRIPDREDR